MKKQYVIPSVAEVSYIYYRKDLSHTFEMTNKVALQ